MYFSTKAALAALLIALPGVSAAATFDVDEADFGDFEDAIFQNQNNINVGTATAGFSSIIGNLDGQCVDNGFIDCNSFDPLTDTTDTFNFTIEAGFELVDVSVGTEGGGPDGLVISFSIAEFINGAVSFVDQVNLPVNSGGMLDFAPLGAGTYNLAAFGQNAAEEGFYSVFWAIELDVQAVAAPEAIPLPAGLPLLAAGLGVFGLARARQRR